MATTSLACGEFPVRSLRDRRLNQELGDITAANGKEEVSLAQSSPPIAGPGAGPICPTHQRAKRGLELLQLW